MLHSGTDDRSALSILTMQGITPFCGAVPTCGPFYPFTNTQMPCQVPNPAVVGEGDVTSLLLPDGSVQYYFLPSRKWCSQTLFNPYMLTNGCGNGNYPLNQNQNGAWIIRSISNPTPAPQPQFIQPQCPIKLNCLKNTINCPCTATPIKFHNDGWTSTTDLRYFSPRPRRLARLCAAGVQVSPPEQSHSNVVHNNPSSVCEECRKRDQSNCCSKRNQKTSNRDTCGCHAKKKQSLCSRDDKGTSRDDKSTSTKHSRCRRINGLGSNVTCGICSASCTSSGTSETIFGSNNEHEKSVFNHGCQTRKTVSISNKCLVYQCERSLPCKKSIISCEERNVNLHEEIQQVTNEMNNQSVTVYTSRSVNTLPNFGNFSVYNFGANSLADDTTTQIIENYETSIKIGEKPTKTNQHSVHFCKHHSNASNKSLGFFEAPTSKEFIGNEQATAIITQHPIITNEMSVEYSTEKSNASCNTAVLEDINSSCDVTKEQLTSEPATGAVQDIERQLDLWLQKFSSFKL